MSKIAGIRERIVKWWQSYNLWVFVALVFLFVIILWIADHENSNYQHLNTASIVLSIALSSVVIGYMLAQNVRANIAQDRIERMAERVEDRLQAVAKRTERMEKLLDNTSAQSQTAVIESQGTVSNVRYVGKGDVFFSIVRTSNIARLFAYFLLRSNTLGRALSIDLIIPIIDPLLKMPTSEVNTYVLGILQGMMCGLEGYLKLAGQKKVHLEKLPQDFKGQMKIVVSWMKKSNPDIEVYLNKIDAIQ